MYAVHDGEHIGRESSGLYTENKFDDHQHFFSARAARAIRRAVLSSALEPCEPIVAAACVFFARCTVQLPAAVISPEVMER